MTLYGDNHYALGLPFSPAASGTASVTAASSVVTGVATAFLSEFRPGDVIILGGESHLVATVPNNTNLTTVTVWGVTVAGGVIGGAELIDLQKYTILTPEGIMPPKGNFVAYSQPLDLGSGGLRGGGWATDEWKWGFLPRGMRDLLRGSFFTVGIPGVPVVSRRLYMRTSVTEAADAYKTFLAWALWPQKEERQATRRIGFSIRFRALAEIT